MNHYSVRLNLKTQSQYHRILWTVTAVNGVLPLSLTAAVYEIYKQHISEHQAYKIVSDYHDLDALTPEEIREMACAEEFERHFAWNDLELELETNGSPMRLQAVAIQEISLAKLQEYRSEGVVDNHLNITL